MHTRSLIKKTAEVIMYGKLPYGLVKHIPQGLEFYLDLRKYKSDYYPKTVFDVGANTGQTVIKWNKFFPKTEYYCFEPVNATMTTLKKNTARYKNIHYRQYALGAERKQADITLCSDPSLNSFVNSVKEIGEKTERVEIETIDSVCESESLSFIDVLKIDTEGFDIEVLKGAIKMLETNRIMFIQVEAGMNPYNKLHVPLQNFVDYLAQYNYVLFGIYEQHLEWTGEKRLSFSNPVFVCGNKID